MSEKPGHIAFWDPFTVEISRSEEREGSERETNYVQRAEEMQMDKGLVFIS